MQPGVTALPAEAIVAEPARVLSPTDISPKPAGDDELADLAQQLVAALAGLAMSRASASVGGLTSRLTDIAENGGTGLTSALRGARSTVEGNSPKRARLSAATGGVKDKVMGALGGATSGLMDTVKGTLGGGDDDDEDEDDGSSSGDNGGGGGIMDRVKGLFGRGGGDDKGANGEEKGGGGGGGSGKGLKVTNIVEQVDVGVPLRVAYNQWTQFQDFSDFMKKVESVEQESDEKTKWQAKVLWSRRTWEATTLEQIPDTHIIWRASGAKGSVDGTVSFHEITPNLTRILVVMEYSPKGLFENTGNIWRAQGRRARLEIKHFRRHVMTKTILEPDEVEGWRGEIRDSEVVKTHEEGLQEEEDARIDAGESESEPDEDYADSPEDDETDGLDDETAEEEEEEEPEAADEQDITDEDAAEEEDVSDDEGVSDEDAQDEDEEDVSDEAAQDEVADDEGEDDSADRSPPRRARRGSRRAPARAGR